ncbi:nuclear transport factor 2 family protein [Streptomyces olivaceoviridis]|uniref:nuclear transport factor 2 family protein n=1 Tax=Streptomyces olivaceoviridis TaxID=1921 RepID=UPI00368F6C6E
MSVENVAMSAAGALFGRRDVNAVDQWALPNYKQHSPLFADGPDGLRELIASLSDDFRYVPQRSFVDGDHVVLHGTYYGFRSEPQVAFDILRVENEKLAEHWDGIVPERSNSNSGRSQVDGETVVTDLDRTEDNRALVRDFVETVLVGKKFQAIDEYVSAERYDEHNPAIGDGRENLRAALVGRLGSTANYQQVRKVLAQGNFILVLSEGEVDDALTAFWDLFRVQGDRIVEHWDVTQQIPADLPHDNGVF